jgi:AcrR family transcriptional regulator
MNGAAPTRVARSRETASGARREAITSAALELFLESGVAATTIAQIKARSRASVGSIYHHFAGKEAIASALYLDGMGSYQTGFLAVLDSAAGAREGVEGAVRYHAGWVQRHAQLARFLAAHREPELKIASERPLREANRRFYAAVFAWARREVSAGRLRALPDDLLYPLWIAPVQEASRSWLASRAKTNLSDAADTLAGAAWENLMPKGEKR